MFVFLVYENVKNVVYLFCVFIVEMFMILIEDKLIVFINNIFFLFGGKFLERRENVLLSF